MKLAIYGHSGSQNHGNEAIVRGLHELFPDAEYTVYTFSESQEVDKKFGLDQISDLKYFTNPNKYPYWLKVIRKIICTIFKKLTFIYKFKPFIDDIDKDTIYCLEAGDQYCEKDENIRKWYAYCNKKIREKGAKSVMLSCSIVPEVINLPEVQEDLKNYSLIIARETLTYNLLKQIGIKNLCVAPCPVFAMKSKKCVLPECFEKNEVIGFNIGFLAQGNEKFVDMLFKNYENAIEYILKETNYEILLVPHVNWNYQYSDFRSLEKLYAKYEYSGRITIMEEKSAPEVKYVLSKLKAFVGLRTHTQIPAIESQTPTIIAGYKHKSLGISNDVYGENTPLLAHVQALSDENTIKNKLIYVLENYQEIKTFMNTKIPSYTQGLNIIKEKILELSEQ